MVRFATNVLLTGLAIALLGILVLLSTTADEAVRRQADLDLRQLRETAAAIERDALSSRNLQMDNGAGLRSLDRDVRVRVESIGRDLHQLFPVDPNGLARMRTIAEAGFNSIDPRNQERVEAEPLLRKLAALNQSAARLSDRVTAFRENQTRYLQLRQTLTRDSRAFVAVCANTAHPSLADSIFRGVQQVLERAERGGDTDLDQIEPVVTKIENTIADQRPG